MATARQSARYIPSQPSIADQILAELKEKSPIPTREEEREQAKRLECLATKRDLYFVGRVIPFHTQFQQDVRELEDTLWKSLDQSTGGQHPETPIGCFQYNSHAAKSARIQVYHTLQDISQAYQMMTFLRRRIAEEQDETVAKNLTEYECHKKVLLGAVRKLQEDKVHRSVVIYNNRAFWKSLGYSFYKSKGKDRSPALMPLERESPRRVALKKAVLPLEDEGIEDLVGKGSVPDEIAAEFRKRHMAYLEALCQFTEPHFPMAVLKSKEYKGQGLPFVDIVQEATLGLRNAGMRFNWRADVKFCSYGIW